jgi:hypothetical protein
MTKEKYGFVYIWFDRKHKRYYVGCRWGSVDDGYICSSPWMKQSYLHRPNDFKRRVIKSNIPTRRETFAEELRYLLMIKPSEIKPTNNNPRYYNLNITHNALWHAEDDQIKTVGEKISLAKTGRKNGPMTEDRKKNISEAKKKKFAEKQELLGYKVAPETLEKMSQNRRGKTHTEEWKLENSKRMKKQWSDGSRKRAQPKSKMSREEQDRDSAIRLKSKWADPVWAEAQRQKLKEGAKKRPPRSEESKLKARHSQLGKPKNRTHINKHECALT